MKPALFGVAAIGTEDRLPGERRRSGKGMHVHEQRIIDAVELDGLPDGSVEHPGIALDGRAVLTEAVEPVEHPHLDRAPLRLSERAERGCDDDKFHHLTRHGPSLGPPSKWLSGGS